MTDGGEVRETTSWVPALDLASRCAWTRSRSPWPRWSPGSARSSWCTAPATSSPATRASAASPAVLTAFAGSMLGLVLADDLLLLYVFWELTTVFSYLLIGGCGARLAARRAASQALILTTAGGLAMLVGLIMIGQTSGSYLLSEVVAHPGSGTVLVAGTVLVLVGAITKSAMVPFHFWLPAAMEAPTPVSAYLHAAAMVKAGIYLVARLAPGFADVPGWRPIVLGLALATMLRRRLPRAAAERPQAAARLRHGQPARLPDRARRGRQPGAGRRRAGDDRRPRTVQVHAVPHRRRRRPRHRHPRPAAAVRARAAGCPVLAVIGGLAARVDGRPAAAARVRRQGGGLHRAAGRRARRPHGRGRGAGRAGARVGAHRRLHAALPVGCLRPQARLRRHRRCAPAGALFLAAPGRAGPDRAGARPGQPAAGAAGRRVRRRAAR